MSDHDPSRIRGSGRNRAVFDSVDLVGSYNPDGGLTPAEDRLIGAWVPPEPSAHTTASKPSPPCSRSSLTAST